MKSLVEYINESTVNETYDHLLQDINDIFSASDLAKCKKIELNEMISDIAAAIESFDEKANMRKLDAVLRPYAKYTVYELDEEMIDDFTGGDPDDLFDWEGDVVISTEYVHVGTMTGKGAAVVGCQIWTASDYDYKYWILLNN